MFFSLCFSFGSLGLLFLWSLLLDRERERDLVFFLWDLDLDLDRSFFLLDLPDSGGGRGAEGGGSNEVEHQDNLELVQLLLSTMEMLGNLFFLVALLLDQFTGHLVLEVEALDSQQFLLATW